MNRQEEKASKIRRLIPIADTQNRKLGNNLCLWNCPLILATITSIGEHLQVYSNEELCQAYKYLANYYIKRGRLDEGYAAAQKCTDFNEVGVLCALPFRTLWNGEFQFNSQKGFFVVSLNHRWGCVTAWLIYSALVDL